MTEGTFESIRNEMKKSVHERFPDSMKTIKSVIEVEIKNIEVDDRYYSFKYTVKQDGKEIDSGYCEDDYENGDTPNEWKKTLEEGYAIQKVIVRAFE